MSLPGEDHYTWAERRHMWLWGAGAMLLMLVGAGVVVSSGPLLAAVALFALGAGVAHVASEPRRERWQARMSARVERRTEALS